MTNACARYLSETTLVVCTKPWQVYKLFSFFAPKTGRLYNGCGSSKILSFSGSNQALKNYLRRTSQLIQFTKHEPAWLVLTTSSVVANHTHLQYNYLHEASSSRKESVLINFNTFFFKYLHFIFPLWSDSWTDGKQNFYSSMRISWSG